VMGVGAPQIAGSRPCCGKSCQTVALLHTDIGGIICFLGGAFRDERLECEHSTSESLRPTGHNSPFFKCREKSSSNSLKKATQKFQAETFRKSSQEQLNYRTESASE
jgi:hypothetical protein